MITFEFYLRGWSALQSHKWLYPPCNSTSLRLNVWVFTILYLVLCSTPSSGSSSPPCVVPCAKTVSSSASTGHFAKKCVKILVLKRTDVTVSFEKSVNAGFFASLFSRKCQVGEGYTIEIVIKNMQLHNIGKTVDDAVGQSPDLVALAMLYGDFAVKSVLPTLEKHNMVLFSPITGSSQVRFWHRNLYFIRPSPTGELFALLRYALNTLHYRRLGFMYLQGVSFGDTEYELAVSELARMGRSICCTFELKSSITQTASPGEIKAAFNKFAEGSPQATIMFGSPIPDSAKFLKHFWTDPRTKGGMVLAPSILHAFIALHHKALVKEDASFVSGRLITTGTNPLAKEDKFDAVKRFQKDMRDYLSKSGQGDYNDTKAFLHNDMDGEMMVLGWIAGETLVQALSTPEWKRGRAAFMDSLYNQRRYMIDDLVIGDFGGDCSKLSVTQGAICQCNQGGKNVFMKEIAKDYSSLPVPEGMMSFPPTDCFTNKVGLRSQLKSVMLVMEDRAAAKEASNHMSAGIRAASSYSDAFGQPTEFSVSSIATKDSTAVDDLQHALLEKDVDALIGFAPHKTMEFDKLVLISPLFGKPRLNVYRRNVISILPTVEQQFFRVSNYFQSEGITAVHAIIRSDEGQDIIDILQKSLETFGVLLRSSRVLSDEEALDGKMPDTGDSVIVGITTKDVPVIAAYLESHSRSRVVILFQDLCLLYSELVAAFTEKSIAHRLLFVTNLPHWSNKYTKSKTGEMFFRAVPDEALRTPLAMAGFAIARFVHYASAHLVVANSTTFLEYIYATPIISSDDMLYGPFIDKQKCVTDKKANHMTCQINFGATFMSVWSMARSLNSSVHPLSNKEVPSLKYRSPSSGTLSPNETLAVIIGSVIGVFLILALIAVAIIYCVKNRHNAYAPKDMEHPVTLIFTDIQSSTALWAECSDIMANALETHHRLIRRLIAKYRCYEVKTIGDSFMIACKSASAAVQLVGDLQRTFLQHDWATSAMDVAYHKFEERQAAEDEDYEPPTARLDAAVYRKYWSGLRVRAGVHTGLSDIQHDEVTKRYDYYGSTSNTAARTESVAHGGQVLLTDAAYMALSAAERAGLDVTALGPVELRGVPEPVEMYQLNAVPGRAFAKLRIEKDDAEIVDKYCDQSTDESSGMDNCSGSDWVCFLLCTLFSRLSPKARLKALQPFCDCWEIGNIRRLAAYSDEKVSDTLISQIARRVGRVANRERRRLRESLSILRRSQCSILHLSKSTGCTSEASTIEAQCTNPWIYERF